MRLYIGNATRQLQNFTYRLPEVPGARSQMILIGGQIAISGDLNKRQIDAIIEQHEPYGLIAIEDIDRTRPFVGLCYSLDREISPGAIEKLMRHNTSVLVERGKSLRVAAAVVEENRINNQLQDNDLRPLRNFEMSVVEESPLPSPDGTEPVAEGYRIQRDATAA